jgi:hypothetical protein
LGRVILAVGVVNYRTKAESRIVITLKILIENFVVGDDVCGSVKQF